MNNIFNNDVLFRAMINNGGDVIMLKSKEGKLLYVSQSITNVLGYTPEECLAAPYIQFNHPEELALWHEWELKINNSPGQSLYNQLRLRHKDGTYRWCESISSNFLQAPDINAIVINFRDISERKKVEEQLKISETYYRLIFEQATDAVYIIDSTITGKLIDINESGCRLLGYTKEEFLSLKPMDIIFEEDLKTNPIKARDLQTGQSVKNERRLKRKDGTDVLTESIGKKMQNGNFLIFARDISESKKLQEQQALFASIVNSSDDAILSKSITGTITSWNYGAEKVFGYTAKEAIGKNISMLIPPHLLDEEIKIMREISKGNSIDHYETERITKEGAIINVSLTISPIKNSFGEIIGASKISRDITIKKKTERKLQKSETFNRGIINSLNSHIAVINSLGIIVAVNHSWTQFALKNTENNLLNTGEGANYFEVCKRVAQNGAEEALNVVFGIKEIMNGKKNDFYLEYPCHSATEKRWFGMRALKFEGSEQLVVINHHNITERKLAEENIKKNEAQLKDAQSIAHIGSWEIDMEQNILYWSDEQFNILGLKKGEVTASNELFLSMVHPDDAQFVNQGFYNTFQTFENSSNNFRIVLKNGTIKHVFCEWKFEFDLNLKPIRIYGIIQDVTEKKLAEEKIINSEIKIRNFAKHLNQIQEEERAHIAREIHDELGQELVGIKIGLSSFLKNNAQQKNREAIKSMMNSVDTAIQSLRKIATELRPGILDTLGLMYSIEWLGKEFERKNNIKCMMVLDIKEQNIRKDISICFFRICQEALTNVSKHAECTEVKIILLQNANELFMKISDNGKGIQSEILENNFSMGMLGMKERALNIGSELIVESRKNLGTSITIKALIN